MWCESKGYGIARHVEMSRGPRRHTSSSVAAPSWFSQRCSTRALPRDGQCGGTCVECAKDAAHIAGPPTGLCAKEVAHVMPPPPPGRSSWSPSDAPQGETPFMGGSPAAVWDMASGLPQFLLRQPGSSVRLLETSPCGAPPVLSGWGVRARCLLKGCPSLCIVWGVCGCYRVGAVCSVGHPARNTPSQLRRGSLRAKG